MNFGGHKTRVLSDGQLSLHASIVTIGAFDGVHRGHQRLIGDAVEEARHAGLPSVVMTFDPPPKVFFGRAARLSRLDDKLARIAQLGPDYVVVASFTRSYSARSPERFLADIARFGPRRILVGADFRFGAKQAGDVALLARHFDVRLAETLHCRAGEVVSSSRIRALRSEGRATEAAQLQGCRGAAALLAGRLQIQDMRYGEASHD
ncbi:FAD synthetase [Roseibium sp.]|uniref:FAD synthetase n=1 Tax=Roseibium sp. TaxID=1936156 RepID=UPI003A978B85